VLHHAMLTAAAEAESPETGSDLPFGAKEERPLARSPGRSNVRSFALRQRALRRAARVRWVVLAEDDHAFDVPGLVRTLGYLNDSRAFSMGQNGPWIKKPLMKIEWPQIHTAIQVQGRLFAQNAGRKKSHLLEQGSGPLENESISSLAALLCIFPLQSLAPTAVLRCAPGRRQPLSSLSLPQPCALHGCRRIRPRARHGKRIAAEAMRRHRVTWLRIIARVHSSGLPTAPSTCSTSSHLTPFGSPA